MELMAVCVKFQKFFNVLMINSHQPEVVSSYEKCLCIENIHKVNTDWHTKRMQMKNSMEDAKKKIRRPRCQNIGSNIQLENEHMYNIAQYIYIQGRKQNRWLKKFKNVQFCFKRN